MWQTNLMCIHFGPKKRAINRKSGLHKQLSILFCSWSFVHATCCLLLLYAVSFFLNGYGCQQYKSMLICLGKPAQEIHTYEFNKNNKKQTMNNPSNGICEILAQTIHTA